MVEVRTVVTSGESRNWEEARGGLGNAGNILYLNLGFSYTDVFIL